MPDIVSWHSLPGDPVSNVSTANTTLNSRGIAHPRPYQINEYGASNEQNPADGAWYISRLERAGADGLRANWAGGSNLHNDLANLLTHNSAGQYSTKGEWWVYRFYGSQTGQIAAVTPSANYDAFATKDSGNAKILVGGGTTTGNVAVNLQNLNTTSGIVQNNQVRVLTQRIPYNSGGAVTGPVTVQDTVVTLSNNGTTVNLPHTAVDDTFTITLLPPNGSTASPSPSPSVSPSSSPSVSPSVSPSASPSVSPSVPVTGACSATIETTNSWPGGFQSNVTVRAGGSAVNGWTVKWTWPSGQTISSLWNGTQTVSGSSVTVRNADYNGSIAAGGSTTFGFTANGSAATPTATCTSP
ncbi:cellulose binding domain-containing protein [Microbispora sp. RL4-1S]|uniref:Cellulose binding domain-containing protein n=1 Tax=Microbispora oryzae TaxID=2806554 RepID=A0A940WQH9_9ACTN|nr:cellulose binding domain-containing protein [Microbispora oryzae]